MPVAHHSRGWLRRARVRWPWLVPTIVAGCLAAGTGVVVVNVLAQRASADGCPGTQVTITVAASASTYPVLDRLAQSWTASRPVWDGKCLAAAVVDEESSQVARALAENWNTELGGPRPDVWVPDSSLWLAVAAGRIDAATMLPAQPPSLGSSPIVLAVRAPVAQALGFPSRTLDWSRVIAAFGAPGGWAALGHPDWAGLRMGLADPTTSTAGLAALLDVLDPDGSGGASDQELVATLSFTQTLGPIASNTGVLLTGQGATGSTVAAFPVLESELADHNARHPDQAMVPVYANGRPVRADYPYVVLSSGWVGADRSAAAESFLAYLQQPSARAALAAAGLRNTDGGIDNAHALPASAGFAATLPPARATPDPAALSTLLSQWGALQRRANVLVTLDTSGSMNLPVPGTDLTRLQLMQRCAITGFGLFTGQSSVGLWALSTRSGSGHEELVPLGPVAGTIDGTARKRVMVNAVEGLQASGATPLYDTIYAAFHAVQGSWQPNSANVVLIITDGANDYPTGLNLTGLLGKLAADQRPDRPVQIIGIAVGPQADTEALAQIAGVTGGRVVVARDPAAATQTLVLAFAGRLT